MALPIHMARPRFARNSTFSCESCNQLKPMTELKNPIYYRTYPDETVKAILICKSCHIQIERNKKIDRIL